MATLKVNITESITLNGNNFGAKNTLSVSGVNSVNKRIIECITGSGGTQIYAGAAAAASGTFKSADVKYIRITNTDATNYVVLNLEGNSHESSHKLEAGKTFILGTPVGFDTEVAIDSFSGETIDTIKAKANSAVVKLEVYVATA